MRPKHPVGVMVTDMVAHMVVGTTLVEGCTSNRKSQSIKVVEVVEVVEDTVTGEEDMNNKRSLQLTMAIAMKAATNMRTQVRDGDLTCVGNIFLLKDGDCRI